MVFNGEMWKRFEPLLRSDFTIFDSYQWRHNTEPPFAFPIHAFWGTEDKRITQELVKVKLMYFIQKGDVFCSA